MKLLPSGNSTCWIFQGRHQDVQWNLQNCYLLLSSWPWCCFRWSKETISLPTVDKPRCAQLQVEVSSRLVNASGDTEAILFQGYGSLHPCCSVPVWQLAMKGTQYSNPTVTRLTGDRVQIKVTSFPQAKAILYFPVKANSATINKDKLKQEAQHIMATPPPSNRGTTRYWKTQHTPEEYLMVVQMHGYLCYPCQEKQKLDIVNS